MAGYLVESNIYSPAISKVDANNDEANLQLANRTRYLNNALNNLSNYLGTVKDDLDIQIEELTDRINKIRAVIGDGGESPSDISTSDDVVRAVEKLLHDVSTLETLMTTHKHNYAGASKSGGPAAQVQIVDDVINRLSLVGTEASSPNNLKRNSQIYIEENGIHADVFYGNLEGIADAAETLAAEPNISLSGDVIGSATFTGNKDLNITTSLKDQNISPGEYGETSNYTLSLDGSMIIPSITVNAAGVITAIQNRVVQLPSNLGTNNSISAKQDLRKVFLVGADTQGRYASTYSQSGVYAKDNHLYSNNDEVVTINDRQDLLNKTINGYIPNDAMEYTVDNTIGGTLDSNSLITSNAVARHTHNYASSKNPSGDAETIEINPQENEETYRVVINKNNKLYQSAIEVTNSSLKSNTLIATDNMFIPGGKIWIENVEPSDDSGGNMFPGDFLNPDDYVKRVSTEQLHKTANSCLAGQLLSYRSEGYTLADNSSKNTSKNLAIALEDSNDKKTMNVMILGLYNLGTEYYDGADAYVGKKGDIIYGKPMDDNIVIRKIGYVRNNYLVFQPGDSENYEKVESLERAFELAFSEGNNFTWQMDEFRNLMPRDDADTDNMWEIDELGDIMPSKYSVPNNYWKNDKDSTNSIVPADFSEEESLMTTFEEDDFGNLVPKEEYSYDSMWEIDEFRDIMPSKYSVPNNYWKNDKDSINSIVPADFSEGNNFATWQMDEFRNLVPKEEYSYDSMWEIDELGDIMSSKYSISNGYWENDKDNTNSIVPVDFSEEESFMTTFEEDDLGNLIPKEEYDYDSMWEYDKEKDFAPAEDGKPNKTWEYDEYENIIPFTYEPSGSWDNTSNEITPLESYVPDTMWNVDEKDDYMPENEGTPNETWDYDDAKNVEPAE